MAFVKVEKVRTVASISACRVDDRTDADLLVYVTDSRGISFDKDHVWSYVENDSEASIKIFWDQVTPTADLKVCFVDDLGVSGWMSDNHRLSGALV